MPADWRFGSGVCLAKDQISHLSRQQLQRELRLVELASQNEKLRKQLGTMRSPAFLEMRIRELNLGLSGQSHRRYGDCRNRRATCRHKGRSDNTRRGTPAWQPCRERASELLPPSVTLSDEEPIAAGGCFTWR